MCSDRSEQAHMPASLLVVVPTYNGGALWRRAAQALRKAQQEARRKVWVLVVDSSSRDDSAQVARDCGFEVQLISQAHFDHGGTRNAAALGQLAQQGAQRQADSPLSDSAALAAELVVFLTQDAIIEGGADLDALAEVFADERVAVAYGRQLPHEHANPIARHARQFNYPDTSAVRSRQDIARFGIKTAFVSNAFAAYRLSIFKQLGGFPERTILSEDMCFAARAILAGYRVAYVAQARVRHSHNYTPLEEFRRYFDIGVFQSDQAWIGHEFGSPGGEGLRFIRSEFRYLLRRAPLWVPRALLHNALKIVGYKLGKKHLALPQGWPAKFSMNSRWW